jgi:uncharacterized protein
MLHRCLHERVQSALADTPVVVLLGARQTGKTTLARSLVEDDPPRRYLTFDDAGVLAAAAADAAGFLDGLDGAVTLDEVQQVPELFPALKAAVDRDRRPGRFLLTGSTNVMALPKISQALVGRMEIVQLWPFSQGELEGRCTGLVERLLAGQTPSPAPSMDLEEVLQRIVRGGYPEVTTRAAASRRSAWFESYSTTILQRDVRDLANIDRLATMPRLLSLLAARATGLLNYAELSRSSGIPQSTLKRYLALLEATFLVQVVPAWSTNLSKRLVRSPKLILNDTGLLCHLLGMGSSRLEEDRGFLGSILENFVLMEIKKQISWLPSPATLYHFRTQGGLEVDALLEDTAGRVVGIEVKSSTTVGGRDFRGLKFLAESLGERFLGGVVLYTGEALIPFGRNLHAVPLATLWQSKGG